MKGEGVDAAYEKCSEQHGNLCWVDSTEKRRWKKTVWWRQAEQHWSSTRTQWQGRALNIADVAWAAGKQDVCVVGLTKEFLTNTVFNAALGVFPDDPTGVTYETCQTITSVITHCLWELKQKLNTITI